MSDAQTPPEPPSTPPPPPPPSAPPPPQSGAGPGGASSNRSVMIVLSYLWLLALIPFLAEKEDAEVQWHAKHGLVLTAAEIVLWIVLSIVNFAIGVVFAPLSCVLSLLFLVLALALVGLHVYAIVKGLDGQRLIIPHVSEYADRF